MPNRYIIRIIGRLKSRVTSDPHRFPLGIKIVICFSPYLVIGHVVANEQSSHVLIPFLSRAFPWRPVAPHKRWQSAPGSRNPKGNVRGASRFERDRNASYPNRVSRSGGGVAYFAVHRGAAPFMRGEA